MFLVGNLLNGIGVVLDTVLYVYMIIIIISALISWVNPDPNNPIVRFLRSATEPVYRPIRKFLAEKLGFRSMIDISPIIAILATLFLKEVVVQSIFDLAHRMK
ncbi:MAG TPA: YggT family protein [Nitrospirae bacterium]|nr:YggT family protein [Nitrospirota bacterium]